MNGTKIKTSIIWIMKVSDKVNGDTHTLLLRGNTVRPKPTPPLEYRAGLAAENYTFTIIDAHLQLIRTH